MHVAVMMVELRLPGCASLKEKRGRLKPLLAGLHREFNVSAAEIERQDSHTAAVIACAVVSSDGRHAQQVLDGVPGWIEARRPDLQVVDQQLMTW
jgi:uncharacterized protein YlxP (DUF503 family)